MQRQRVRVGASLVLLTVAMMLAACGDDSDDSSASGDTTTTVEPTAPNACPQEGCTIEFDEVVRAGDELKVTWTANFTPDFSRNHIHVYWDTYTAEQVSDDAAAKGFEQGSWHPTDEYPEYTTESEASVTQRNGSTKLCVTAGDRNHNVIDATLFECRDVQGLL